jgi:cholesterol transport system auxiliary component
MITRLLLVLATTLLLAACTGFTTSSAPSQNIYVLEMRTAIPAAAAKRDLVLAIGVPQARPGFDTAQMVYVQQAFELNNFVTSRWAAPPARMLESLLVQTLEQSGGFRAVVPVAGAIPGDVRLETELLRLQQDFTARPSRVQLTLRAQLIDVRGKRILAVKQFDESENTTSDDAYGGVTAANRALQRVMESLVHFCTDEAATR